MSSYQSSCSSIRRTDLCACGLPPVLKTSWTDNNPGRRFWSCSQYKKNAERGCNFYEWHDPPVAGRSKNIIPGLLRRIENLEDEIKRGKEKQKKLAKWLKFVVLALCFVCMKILFTW